MFKRIRELHISLAAKCQLLFGAAVVMIIAAALFVPWQRMEQLTEQINDRTAHALSEATINQHLAWQTSGALIDPTLTPRNAPFNPATIPLSPDGHAPTIARLIMLYPQRLPSKLTSFETKAAEIFEKNPDQDSTSKVYKHSVTKEQGYRYARVLRAEPSCIRCHPIGNQSWQAGASTLPASSGLSLGPTPPSPTTAPQGMLIPTAPATRPGPATTRATTLPAGGAALAQNAPVLGMVSIDMPSQIEANQLLLNRVILLTAGLLAGTLALVIFYVVTTRLILQPVRILQETAEKVSQGDLNIRSDISSGDEFQQLSDTFNTMLANLKAGQDQLRAINKSLDLKLGQLAESNLALYESNRLKSEFLANVSHELRTPLNSILGFAELLRDTGGAADARTGRYAANILTSGRALLDLINDLLDLAKIEAGRMEVRSEPLSLNDLFEGLSNILKPLAEKKELTVVTTIQGDVPILQTDGPKLQQVLYNFISNAIKFSPSKGRIDLKAERIEEERVRISVTDQGPGIEPEKHLVIFEKFRQIDGSVTREHGGSGLGLAISKELVSLLSGQIGVISTPGEGATFWIVLPVKIQAGAQDVRQNLVLT